MFSRRATSSDKTRTANRGTLLGNDHMCSDRFDSLISKMEWRRGNRLPTYCVNWVCNTWMKRHNVLVRDRWGQRSGRLPPGHSELPEADSSCLRPDPVTRCARQRRHGERSAELQQWPAGAGATTLVTVSPVAATALLESRSYTQRLSAGRTCAGPLGAQGWGQTAWFHTSRGST